MNIARFIGHLMIAVLIGIIIFVVLRFVGQRDKF
jgi:hypothetical protein